MKNSDQFQMGWNDLICNIRLYTKLNKKLRVIKGVKHYLKRYTGESDYDKGVQAAGKALLSNKPVKYKGPAYVVADLKHKELGLL